MITLSILEGKLAICRLPANAPLPTWALTGDFYNITRTAEELSIVCAEKLISAVPETGDLRVEPGWRGLKIVGTLDFSLTGILARIANTLAKAEISIFAISTYDTDYILLQDEKLAAAVEALTQAGYQF